MHAGQLDEELDQVPRMARVGETKRMLDSRALAWRYLLPSNAQYEGTRAPAVFAPLLTRTPAEDSPRILLWSGITSPIPSLGEYAGVVVVHPRPGLTTRMRRAGLAATYDFAVLPSLAQPRLFVPIGNSAVSASALSHWHVSGKRMHVLQTGARIAARCGLRFVFPSRITIGLRDRSGIENILEQIWPDKDHHFALALRPRIPDVSQKMSFTVIDNSGEVLGFGKISERQSGQLALAHEGRMLSELRGRLGANWKGPRLLHSGESDGRFMILQSPVRGEAPGAEFSPAHGHFLDRLGGGPPKRAADTEFVRSLQSERWQHGEPPTALDLVLPLLNGLFLPETVTHGDFESSNVLRCGDEIVAFDWELAYIDGLPLIDELHYRFLNGYLFEGQTTASTEERIRRFAAERPRNLAPEQVEALAVVCLLNLIRHLEHRPNARVHIEPLIALTMRLADHVSSRIATVTGLPGGTTVEEFICRLG